MKNTLKTDPEKILDKLWIVESASKNGTDIFQGTGFELKGYGLITCAHVIRDRTTVYRRGSNSGKVVVEIKYIDKELDVAVLLFSAPENNEFDIGSSEELNIGDTVFLAGFPNHAEGHSGSFLECKISAFKEIFGKNHIALDKGVVSGNSGGPLLNTGLRVVGIAVRGGENLRDAENTDNNLALPIEIIKNINAN